MQTVQQTNLCCLSSVSPGVFCPAGLELCDLPHRLTVAMVAVLFAIGAETVLPAVALACHSWQILQAVVTLPLVLLLPYWW